MFKWYDRCYQMFNASLFKKLLQENEEKITDECTLFTLMRKAATL